MTLDTYDLCRQEINNKLSGMTDVDWSEIHDKYNVLCASDTIRKSSNTIFGGYFVSEYLKWKSEKSSNAEPVINYRSESSINRDGTFTSDKLIAITEDDLKNSNSLLKAHGFDTRDWELVSARNNIWNVYSKQDGVKELYSSKIVVKPRSNISLSEISDFYKELICSYTPPIVKKYPGTQDGSLVELPIFDLHLGKFSSSEDVGSGYNSKVARDSFNYVVDRVVERLRGQIIEKIIFPIGNDFFNYDSVAGTTTAGTMQDSDRKHQRLFKDGVLLLIDGISKLSAELMAPIEVFCVPGNHDFMSSYHATMSLWCYFNNNDNVTVDLGTSPRKYVEFGNCLIGFSHGDKESKRIHSVMQVEAREAWGRTKYHEIHLGHLHSEQQLPVKEEGGVIIRHIPSITGTDTWHHESGYVGAIRKCPCFIWDKEYGLDTIFNVPIL